MAKRTLINSRCITPLLVSGVWFSGAFYSGNGSVVGNLADNLAGSSTVFAQSSDNCPTANKADFAQLTIADNSTSINSLVSRCIEIAYKTYASSIQDNFLRPLKIIANERPELRDEAFVTETARLDAQRAIDDFRYLEALVESGLETIDSRDSAIADRLSSIDSELSLVEDAIVTPLFSDGYQDRSLSQIFIYQDGEKAEEVESIQRKIPAIATDPEIQSVLGEYGLATFNGIEQFVETRNSEIESSLTEILEIPERLEEEPTGPVDGERSLGLVFLVIALLFGIPFLFIKVFNSSRGNQNKQIKNSQQDNPSPSRSKPPRKVQQCMESTSNGFNKHAVLSVPEALKPSNGSYSATTTADYENDLRKEAAKPKGDVQRALENRKAVESERVKQEQPGLDVGDRTSSDNGTPKRKKTALSEARSPLSLSKRDLVRQYNINSDELLPGAYAVEPTESSKSDYFHGFNRAIEIESDANGKYWLIQTKMIDTTHYYLVPRKGAQFNAQSIDVIDACFRVKNKGISRKAFKLEAPAVMKPLAGAGEQTWKLIEKGKICFLTRDPTH